MDLKLLKTIHLAVADMKSKVEFLNDNDEHTYIRKSDSARLQGVSEVSSIVPKPWMPAWGAKEAVKALGFSDYILDDIAFVEKEMAEGREVKELPENIRYATQVLEKIRSCKDLKEYISILKDAKGASGRKSKEALVDGQTGHDWLEKYVKARIRGEELPSIPEGNLRRPIEQFLEWEKENIDYWILSECIVAYPDKGYAGRLDALAMTKDGKLTLVDFKFASHISEDYFLQTAGYRHTFDPYEIKIDQRIILRFPKTLEVDEWDKKERKYKKIPNNLEAKVVDTPYEEDIDAFLHALPLKSWINKYSIYKN